jgi:hypothetical protein
MTDLVGVISNLARFLSVTQQSQPEASGFRENKFPILGGKQLNIAENQDVKLKFVG